MSLIDKKGRKQGPWEYFVEVGGVETITARCEYKNDKMHGIRTTYYTNGDVSATYNMKNNVLHGEAKFFNMGNVLTSTFNYSNGKIKDSKYYWDGILKGELIVGAKHQKTKLYTIGTGVLYLEYTTDSNGKQQGKEIRYAKDGSSTHTNYKDDAIVGNSIVRDKDGIIIDKIFHYHAVHDFAHHIKSNALHIGCKIKTIDEWKEWFAGDEVFTNLRGTKEFKAIHEQFNAIVNG